MARDIYINTATGSIEQAVVVGLNRPNNRVQLREIVAGTTETYNIYLVGSNGAYDARSGAADTSVEVSIGERNATANYGNLTVNDGTETSSPWSVTASAAVVEATLNAMNDATGFGGILCDIEKVADGQWLKTNRVAGVGAAATGLSVDLTPESVVNISTSVTGTASIREQSVIDVNRQPAIYQAAWTVITDGFTAELDAATGRVLQALGNTPILTAYFEVRIDGECVCSQPIKLIQPVGGTGSVYGSATLPPAWAANPTAVTGFDASAWVTALDLTSLTTDQSIVLESGGDIAAAYTAAKALTPNGSALSATNRATLALMPGEYEITEELEIDAEFVDVVSLGNGASSFISGDQITVSANDVRISGINAGSSALLYISGDKPLQVFDSCVATSYGSFSDDGGGTCSGTFTNCVGGAFSFGGIEGNC
jgi:hypothetical protein